MIPAEQWQKEAGTWMIHCQGADEEHPVLTVDLIKRIQRDAYVQALRDAKCIAAQILFEEDPK